MERNLKSSLSKCDTAAEQSWVAWLICSLVIFPWTVQTPSNSLFARRIDHNSNTESEEGSDSVDCTFCLSLLSVIFLFFWSAAAASLISQHRLCGLMIWFSYADSYHLPCCVTVSIIVISVQKEAELLAFSEPVSRIPVWTSVIWLSSCPRYRCVCAILSTTDCQYCPASQTDEAKQSHSHVHRGTGALPERPIHSFQRSAGLNICVIDNSKLLEAYHTPQVTVNC